MPEHRFLVCGPALDLEESADSLRLLGSLNLPNGEKFLVTTGKFDNHGLAKNFNVESGYPNEPALLRTLAAWAGVDARTDERFRDGYDLYCLLGIIAKNTGFDLALLIRDATELEDCLSSLAESVAGKLFLTFDATGSWETDKISHPNLLIDLRDERASAFLDLSWQLYETGAAYSIKPYSLKCALMTAADSVGFGNEILKC